ncbi:MAG: hypothetical protein H7263_05085 [Candidatus Sericytochromatia bacterium]|nr:hypothetical protein [Candidatus Sericytochromatia bacterium]
MEILNTKDAQIKNLYLQLKRQILKICTEQLLDNILKKLPTDTIKVIITHRRNTIEAENKIFFINSGETSLANSLDEAVEMLTNKKRES